MVEITQTHADAINFLLNELQLVSTMVIDQEQEICNAKQEMRRLFGIELLEETERLSDGIRRIKDKINGVADKSREDQAHKKKRGPRG
jgi:hypothetical protein